MPICYLTADDLHPMLAGCTQLHHRTYSLLIRLRIYRLSTGTYHHRSYLQLKWFTSDAQRDFASLRIRINNQFIDYSRLIVPN